MLFLTDSFRVDMLPPEETQIRMVPMYPESMRTIVNKNLSFMSCFRKDDIARDFVDQTGLDATVNRSRIDLRHGDRVVNVTRNSEGDLDYWFIDILLIEEC